MPDLASSRSIVRRPSRLGKWLRAAEFGVQLGLVVGMVIFTVHHYRATTRLWAAQAELDRTDPGWRLQDVEAARAVVPDAENSALRVMEAAQLLPEPTAKWLDADFDAELQQIPPRRRLRVDQLARLRGYLNAQAPALAAARTLQDMPRGRFPIVYARNPLDTRLDGVQRTREVRRLLEYDVMTRAEAGDAHGAIASCLAAVNCGRAIGDEPMAVSQLVRVADVISACKTLGRILAQTEPPPDELKGIQDLVREEDTVPYWAVTWRGERAFVNAVFESLESGDTTGGEFAGDKPDWEDLYFPYFFQDNVRMYHPLFFKYMDEVRAAGELPAPLRSAAMQQVGAKIRHDGNNMATLFLPGFLKLDEAFTRCHAVVRCTAAALAAERYRRIHGDWPASLHELVPDFIPAVPADPFTGDELLYRRLTDGVVIYSVSTDGVDDGGNVEAVNPTLPGADLGVRLWDPAKRRQPAAAPVDRP